MNKLYKKSELNFSLVLIVVYCIAMSVADVASAAVNFSNIFSLPVILILCLTIFLFLKKNSLLDKYGLCKPEAPYSKMLFYFPLIILLSVNLWNGTKLTLSIPETILYMLTMFGVGFFEEVLFRGLLFNAILKDNYKTAIAVSSITFGIGHIINLFNGSGMELADNILQIISAVAVGFMFVMIYYKSKSLIYCIITHGLFNALSVFSPEGSNSLKNSIISCIFITVLSISYGLYISGLRKSKQVE